MTSRIHVVVYKPLTTQRTAEMVIPWNAIRDEETLLLPKCERKLQHAAVDNPVRGIPPVLGNPLIPTSQPWHGSSTARTRSN